MPVNALLIRALMSFYLYYGDNFKIECPTGSGNQKNLFEVAQEIANRLTRIFLRDSGRRLCMEGRRSSRPILIGTITFCSMSTFKATMERVLAPVTRPAGPAWLRN